ncbi:hypothetical protein PCH_Pc16g15090 [Penicillium rubens Wisconsin 54-1255]|uniref:Uncharacterized protein n=1 Tax=Penicillium rubens (strain ATCC 28089 / DSM 1075 / NRRL 1951 / Wisconsin 54-1255) TaxID=500485 RepID=B6HA52_PENRW|nr:hypothetical protein PCH_Pc16g15090 [Penicillium rubens Wisconsin 54-1255]
MNFHKTLLHYRIPHRALTTLYQTRILTPTMPTAKFINDNITVSNETDVKLTLYDENNTDESLTLLCPGETRKNFTGKIVSIEPYTTYATRSWQLSEDVVFAANRDVTVTDQTLEQEIRWFGSVKARMEQKLLSLDYFGSGTLSKLIVQDLRARGDEYQDGYRVVTCIKLQYIPLPYCRQGASRMDVCGDIYCFYYNLMVRLVDSIIRITVSIYFTNKPACFYSLNRIDNQYVVFSCSQTSLRAFSILNEVPKT